MPFFHCILQVLEVLLIKICKIQPPDLLFLVVIIPFISADVIFHKLITVKSFIISLNDFLKLSLLTLKFNNFTSW